MATTTKAADLTSLDPIRKAFALSCYAHSLSLHFPEYAQEYQEIREGCQAYARDLLEHCNSTKEV